MTTIINTPGGGNDDSSGFGLIIGIILTLILGGLFVYYILPTLRSGETKSSPNTEIKVVVPAQTTQEQTN